MNLPRLISRTCLLLFACCLFACATAPPPTPAYAPTFHFTYPAEESPAQDVTVAIVRPIEVGSTAITTEQKAQIASGQARRIGDVHHAAFRAAMIAQFQELLSKKGLKQRGPFDDLNSMTFPDKKGSDLTLTTEMGITVRVPEREFVANSSSLEAVVGSVSLVAKTSGPCSVTGFISLVILEPLSGEKIWIKKVDVPATEVDCSGTHSDSDTQFLDNGVGRALEKVYPVVMGQAWKHLSGEELALFKKQSQELRQRKVY
jgi:hypothetical protein